MSYVPLDKKTINRLHAVIDALQELVVAQGEHLTYLGKIRDQLKEAADKVKELKRNKVFVDWLAQHPELDKTEIISLWVNKDYGQIALRYANFNFPEGFFPN